MENASKALLMAAGVLIGVAILSLAVYLYASFGGTAQTIQENIEEGQLEQFNNQYIAFTTKDCTIYDIVTVVNMANDYNTKNGYVDSSADYIKVEVTKITKNANSYNYETLNKVIKEQNSSYGKVNKGKFELYKFSCTVESNPETRKNK